VSEQKPSVGRIVLVGESTTPDTTVEHAAMITRVHSENCVNVTVFPDGGLPYPKTSVVLSEDGSPRDYHWRWPDRV